jgi:hypothetical protein
MTVRGTGWAMASMYSMSRRASTQPPASHTLGLLPPIVVSTVAVTPQAVPKDSRSVLSSAGDANKEIKLVQFIDLRKRGEREQTYSTGTGTLRRTWSCRGRRKSCSRSCTQS